MNTEPRQLSTSKKIEITFKPYSSHGVEKIRWYRTGTASDGTATGDITLWPYGKDKVIAHHRSFAEFNDILTRPNCGQRMYNLSKSAASAEQPAEAPVSMPVIDTAKVSLKDFFSPLSTLGKAASDYVDSVGEDAAIWLLMHGKPPAPPPADSYEAWLQTDDAQNYCGKHTAFVRGTGVVASGDTLDEVYKATGGRHDVDYGMVPGIGAPVPTVAVIGNGDGENKPQ